EVDSPDCQRRRYSQNDVIGTVPRVECGHLYSVGDKADRGGRCAQTQRILRQGGREAYGKRVGPGRVSVGRDIDWVSGQTMNTTTVLDERAARGVLGERGDGQPRIQGLDPAFAVPEPRRSQVERAAAVAPTVVAGRAE